MSTFGYSTTRILRLRPRDNVAVTLADLQAGATVVYSDSPPLTLRDAVPFGHKVAMVPIAIGEPVVKYGETIGLATQPIAPGEHVHTHNLTSSRAQSSSPPAFQPSIPAPSHPSDLPVSQSTNLPISAYLRPDDRMGIRNHLLVLPSVFCANVAAQRIAEAEPGAIALPHPYGCAQLDAERVADTLVGVGTHPNAP